VAKDAIGYCEEAMDPRVKPAGDTREIVNQISWKTLLRPYELGVSASDRPD
jgi:hypothetical protein